MPPEPSAGDDVFLLGRVAAAAAAGDDPGLRQALQGARSAAVAAGRLRETLRMLVPYAGHPRAIAAFAAAGLPPPAAGEAVEHDPVERAGRGRRAFEAVYGPTAERVLAGLARLDPLLPAWTLENAYGRVLARDGLAPVERELIGVSLLVGLGGLPDPLLGHMRGARRLGASADDLARAVDCVTAVGADGSKAQARRLLAESGPR